MPIRRQFVYERHPVRKAPHRRRMQAAGRAEKTEKQKKPSMTTITNSSAPAPDNPANPANPTTPTNSTPSTPLPRQKKPDAAQCGIRPYHIPKNY